MSYKRLRQGLAGHPVHIPRHTVTSGVLELTGHAEVKTFVVGLDLSVMRGCYLSPRNTSHPIAQALGKHAIIIARGMDDNWNRFVYVKELMHMLDDDKDTVSTWNVFAEVLAELNEPSHQPRTLQFISEVSALYKAIGIFCPEARRQAYIL